MASVRYSGSILIQRPVADVFSYMDDVSREHEWQPNLRGAEQEPPGAAAVGTRRHYTSEFMGRSVKNSYEVKAYEPNQHVVLESMPGSTVSAANEILWASEDAGTRITMSVEGKPTGVLRFVPGALLEAAFREQVKESLTLLKQRLESAG
jgi:carbon monoxide dehydrogenase subunit G